VAIAGADMAFMSFDEAGAGLAEHIWRACRDEPSATPPLRKREV
jgi:hypothetical protein